MSKFITANQNNWKKQSWINDFANSPKIARNLTEEYAHDVIEAMSEEYHPTLSAAIESLATRIGLNTREAEDVRRTVIAMYKDEMQKAPGTLELTPEAPGMTKAGDTVTCEQCGSAVNVSKENGTVTKCPKCGAEVMQKSVCATDSRENKLVTAGKADHLKQYQFTKGENKDESTEDEKEQESMDKEKMHKWKMKKEEMQTEQTQQTEQMGKWNMKKEEMETEESSPMQKGYMKKETMEKNEIREEKNYEDMSEKKSNNMTEKLCEWIRENDKNPSANSTGAEKELYDFMHAKKSGKIKSYESDNKILHGYKLHNLFGKEKQASFNRVEILRGVKSGNVLPLKRKYATNPTASAYIKKVQAWFQGANEPTLEGPVTSNNPETLGYPKEMTYTHKPMEVPVGGDSRNWEQKWFEGAAAETKKVLGPSGEELREKEHLQRAKRIQKLEAFGSQKKTAGPVGRAIGETVGGVAGTAAGALVPIAGETGISEVAGGLAGSALGGKIGDKIGDVLGKSKNKKPQAKSKKENEDENEEEMKKDSSYTNTRITQVANAALIRTLVRAMPVIIKRVTQLAKTPGVTALLTGITNFITSKAPNVDQETARKAAEEYLRQHPEVAQQYSQDNMIEAQPEMSKAKMTPKGQEFVSKHVKKHIEDYDMPQDQAVAVALEEAREKGYKTPKAGLKKNYKQVISGTVGEIGGSIAGGMAGKAAGTAAGAAIGSVVPVVGTAIGGALGGLAGGAIGSSLGGKAGDKLSKDELELDKNYNTSKNHADLLQEIDEEIANIDEYINKIKHKKQ